MGWDRTNKVMTGPLNIASNGDIQSATNSQSGDLGTCIRYGSINKWAKYKPQKSEAVGEMTAAQRAAGNYGFDFSDGNGSTTVYSYTLAGALNLALSTNRGGDWSGVGDWPYLRPSGYISATKTEWFRMFDFLNPTNHSSAGYWSLAPQPLTYTIPTSPTNCYTDEWLCSFDIAKTSGAELSLTDFTKDGNSISGWYIGVVYRKSTESTNTAHLIRSTTTAGQLSTSVTHINVTFPEPGTYTGCYVATTATENGDGTGNTIYLPNSTFTFTYSKHPIPVYYSLSWPSVTPAISYADENDEYELSFDILNFQFGGDTNLSTDPPTYGEGVDVQITVLYGSDDVWNHTLQSFTTIDDDNDVHAENLSLTISTPAEDLLGGELDISEGDTLTVRIQLNAYGTDQDGHQPILSYVGSGYGLETTVIIPERV